MGHEKRRRFLVNHAQVRLVAFNLAYCSLLVAVLYVGVWAPLSRGIVDESLSSHERARLGEFLLYLHSRLLPICMGAAVIFAFHTVLLSHRVLGPLVNFCNAFRRIGKGRLDQQIRLRKGDLLHDEACVLDEMRESLRVRLLHIRSIHAKADRTWRQLSGELDSGLVDQRTRDRMDELAKLSSSEWEQLQLDTHRNQNGSDQAPRGSDRPDLDARHTASEERLAS